MKLHYIVLLAIILSTNLHAQNNYFSKAYKFDVYNNGTGIITDSDNYVFISLAADSSLFPTKTVISKINSAGSLLWSKIYTAPNCNYVPGNNLIKKNNQFISTGIFGTFANQNDVILCFFDKNGDTLFTKTYGDSSLQDGWGVQSTRDGGFVITGQTDTYDPNGDVLLIKTDSLGNLQWQKHYGGIYQDAGESIDTCFDGGFIIGGFTESFGENAGSACRNMYCIKTDSTGTLQWSRTFGGPFDDGALAAKQCSDSNLIFGGFYSFYDVSQNTSCDEAISRPWIVKLDLQGNTKWNKTYGDSIWSTSLSTVREIDNGDIIGTGVIFDTTTQSFGGLILKVNSLGDSLWYKTYRLLHGMYNSNFLNDINETNDKGFVACGFVSFIPVDSDRQDVWVLKIDSEGCEVANCIANAINPIADFKHFYLSNYPNPFNDWTMIEAFVPHAIKSAYISIIDLMGRAVMTYHLNSGVNKINVSSEGMAEGLYFCSLLINGQRVASNKMLLIK